MNECFGGVLSIILGGLKIIFDVFGIIVPAEVKVLNFRAVFDLLGLIFGVLGLTFGVLGTHFWRLGDHF